MIGKTILHYKILEKLGEGGMGVVYKAHDTKLDRFVALKFLPKGIEADETEKARFLQEARAASALNHPNVCIIYDIAEEDDQQFIVMEYVDGVTLRQKLKDAPLKLKDINKWAIQIGGALQAAHSKGITHRDIKSDNIMINTSNQVKVMDFGLAKLKDSLKLTKTSSTVGTLAYMAPEQLKGEETDARMDIFSFGVVLFEMLTGKLPFRGEYESAMMYSILNEEPRSIQEFRPDVPEKFSDVINKALEKDPELRYQSAKDMVADLKRLKRDTDKISKVIVTETKPPESISPDTTPITLKKQKILIAAGAAIIAIAIVLVLYTTIFKQPAEFIDSIAVMPFENQTGNPDLEYLSDGIARGISYRLAQLPNLKKVIPSSSLNSYKGKNVDAKTISGEFDINAVVFGWMNQLGENVIVHVEFKDGQTNGLIWGDSFTRPRISVHEIEAFLTKEIVDNLGVQLTSDEEKQLTKQYTADLEAWEYYQMGRQSFMEATETSFNQAKDYFEKAIAKDPKYARGYAGLADVYTFLGGSNIISPEETYPYAKEAANKALKLDDGIPEAHISLGLIKSYYDWDWEGAEIEFKRALEINPSSAEAHFSYSGFLFWTGRYNEALQHIEQALEREPLSNLYQSFMGWILCDAGNYDEAIKVVQNVINSAPDFWAGHWNLAWIYARQGKYEEAINPFESSMKLLGEDVNDEIGILGFLYGKLGRNEEALKQLDKLDALSVKGRNVSPVNYAWVYIGLDDKRQAFEWLEKGYKERSAWMYSLKTGLFYDSIRDEPQFKDLLKRMGLD